MTTGELQVTVRKSDGTAVIDLRGEIDRAAGDALAGAYADATRNGAQAVVLDFGHTIYINSSGIALIVGLLAQAREQAVQVSARGLSDHYREIFEITRLADFVTIDDGSADG